MMIPVVLVILIISVPSSLSITSTPPSRPIDENTSSNLPTIENNNQITPLEDAGLNSTPSCSPPASTNLDVQASCLSPASAFSSHVPQGENDNNVVVDQENKSRPLTSPSRQKHTEEGIHPPNSPQGRHNIVSQPTQSKHREGKEPMTSPLKPYTKITTHGSSSCSTQPHQSPHSPNPGHRIRHQTQPSLLPLTTFLDSSEGAHDPNDLHRIDDLSKCILNYFLMAGLSTTGAWAQHPALSTSIYIQCGLNQCAISILLLARFAVYNTSPEMAVIMVRLSFALAVISGYLSSMPMLAPYFAIIMPIIVAFVCFLARVFRD